MIVHRSTLRCLRLTVNGRFSLGLVLEPLGPGMGLDLDGLSLESKPEKNSRNQVP